MIDIHVLVPYEEKLKIVAMASPEFEIVATNKSRQHGKRFFWIKTTREEATALILKYGSDQVWIR